MAWKGREEGPVEFNELLTSLNNSKIQQSNNALWQTIYQLILKSQQQRIKITKVIDSINNSISTIGDTILNITNFLQNATFWTRNDETVNLPSSIQVIAGTGITLDYTVANQVTISTSGSGAVLPMVNGDEPPQLLSDGAGNLIVIAYDLETEIP